MTLKEFFKNDRYAAFTEVELLTVSSGYAMATMKVTQKHLNGGNVCQGGALFTLADLAFAAACNSHRQLSFSVTSTINFHKSALEGDILSAEAKEVFMHGKLPCCEVKIINQQGELVATFSGLSYRKDVPLPVDELE